MKQVTIVKLGGSAITDKSKEATPDLRTLQASIRQMSAFPDPLVILHGAGSFGHPIVKRTRLQQGLRKNSRLSAIGETELYLDELTRIVEVGLLREGIPFVPLKAMSFLTARDGRINQVFIEPLKRALNAGLRPVIHGDLAFDSSRGVSIISADQIASRLGLEFGKSRVLFGCDVDGVFTDNPKRSSSTEIIQRIDRENSLRILRKLLERTSSDATGGMYGKVQEALTLARSRHSCLIFNLRRRGQLKAALAGDLSSGTYFPPWVS